MSGCRIGRITFDRGQIPIEDAAILLRSLLADNEVIPEISDRGVSWVIKRRPEQIQAYANFWRP